MALRKLVCWPLLLGSFVVLSALNEANAGWGSWGGSYGSYGSHGSWGASYGSWGGSYGGSWGSYGGYHHVGLFHRSYYRHHVRRMMRSAYYGGSWGSYGGSYGSYGSNGSWGGSSGYSSYGSSGYASYGGSSGSWAADCCCGGGTVIEDGGVIEGDSGAPADPPADPVPSDARRSSQGILTVSVPSNAKIFVNDLPTKSTGELRRYVSNGLAKGRSYRYEVRAEFDHDGKTVQQVQSATLQAGRTAHLAFDFSSEQVETKLTINVPENAEVYMSGKKMKSTGTTRTFSTTRIEKGDAWSDYTIRVTVDQDGQTLTKEQAVTLKGGDQLTVDFDFDRQQLADAR